MPTSTQTREIPAEMLADFGTPNAAYVRPAIQDGQPVYAIYSADGTQLAAAPSRALAFTLIRQNDLEAYDAH
jgi:hypothetical protein